MKFISWSLLALSLTGLVLYFEIPEDQAPQTSTSTPEHPSRVNEENSASLITDAGVAAQSNKSFINSSLATVPKAALPSNAQLQQYKQDFFKRMQGRIQNDALGNYQVDISPQGGESSTFLVSRSPIYYPSETDLNSGVRGCALGGYYIEQGASVSMLAQTNNGQQKFNYLCTYSNDSQMYLLIDQASDPKIQASLDELGDSLAN